MLFLKGINRVFRHPLNKGKILETLGRVLWWKYNQLFLHYTALVPFVKQTTFVCHPEDSYAGLVVYTRLPEYGELSFAGKFIRKGDIVVDVGAHLGDFCLVGFANGAKKVYGFEPTPLSCKKLRENIAFNQAQDVVEIIPAAVSDSDGFAHFVMTEHAEINHLKTNRGQQSKKNMEVPTMTLDSFMRQRKINRIQFLKIDVEGAESLVFKGMSQALQSRKIDAILFEVNQMATMYDSSWLILREYITKFGYRIYTIDDKGEVVKMTDNWVPVGTPNVLAISPKSNRAKQIVRK